MARVVLDAGFEGETAAVPAPPVAQSGGQDTAAKLMRTRRRAGCKEKLISSGTHRIASGGRGRSEVGGQTPRPPEAGGQTPRGRISRQGELTLEPDHPVGGCADDNCP